MLVQKLPSSVEMSTKASSLLRTALLTAHMLKDGIHRTPEFEPEAVCSDAQVLVCLADNNFCIWRVADLEKHFIVKGSDVGSHLSVCWVDAIEKCCHVYLSLGLLIHNI